MKLIAGLGNPGRRYAGTRHNLGYSVVEELARRWNVDATRYDARAQGQVGQTELDGTRVWLLKPTTFMNLSGQSVAALTRYYRIEAKDVLVVCDDLALPLGVIRLRAGGSSGGQKGLEDVIRHLGTQDVPRLRIGIGSVHPSVTVEYVLSRFEPDELPAAEAAVRTAADAAECWLKDGIDAAMNRYNRRTRDEGEQT